MINIRSVETFSAYTLKKLQIRGKKNKYPFEKY